MNGKMLDFILIAVVAVVFLGFAIFHPGVGNAIVAWLGLVGLGYYNTVVRHDPALVDRLGRLERPVDHSTTLRAWWR
ncbi:hypothetical protein [Nocardia jiangxiensis]|uniref:Uncharacterized protein n=1 Tax=Nocardia jiangxiensis TaxID=282685 RepID=A0ABW6SFU8_9NOCA|nr:hypothetical protein [Nocardia jiangxiensis]